jgi:hypothetical protein
VSAGDVRICPLKRWRRPVGGRRGSRGNILWRLEFDLSLEQNSPDRHEKRVQNG